MSKAQITTELASPFNWDKVYRLPPYYLVSNSYHFLEITAWAKQHPIGVLREELGSGWYVLFKYSEAIKYIGKYPEWFMEYTEKDWEELRNSLSSKDGVYYGLLVEEEQKKKDKL